MRTKSSEDASSVALETLLDRYERTLCHKQRAIAIVNDQLLDIDDVLNYYRKKMRKQTTAQSDKVKYVEECLLILDFKFSSNF